MADQQITTTGDPIVVTTAPIPKFSLIGLTGKLWQSRTAWCAVFAFLAQQSMIFFPHKQTELSAARDLFTVLAAIFLRLGNINDRDYVANMEQVRQVLVEETKPKQ